MSLSFFSCLVFQAIVCFVFRALMLFDCCSQDQHPGQYYPTYFLEALEELWLDAIPDIINDSKP